MLSILFFNILSLFTTNPSIGKVVDQSGSSITFAKVTCQGSSNFTDIEGNFQFIPGADTITISALGYQTEKIATDNFSGVVVLKPSVPKSVTFRK